MKGNYIVHEYEIDQRTPRTYIRRIVPVRIFDNYYEGDVYVNTLCAMSNRYLYCYRIVEL